MLAVLTEEHVRNRVVQWLTRQGYGRITKLSTLGEHGEDVRARRTNSNNFFIVEVKGEPPGANPRKSRQGFLLTGLAELFLRVRHRRHYRYGLALPATYRELVERRVPAEAVRRLGMEFLFVEDNGTVERVTWRRMGRTFAAR